MTNEKYFKKNPKRIVYTECLQKGVQLFDNINILILCAPCRGFGDVIFATKLKHYIMDWYNIKATIATTVVKSFVSLGEPEADLIQLSSKGPDQCRRFANLVPQKSLEGYDLILVAPLQGDQTISFVDIRHLIPYSTKTNTFMFSEYNDKLSKNFDVNTGIGKGRDGMFFVNSKSSKKDIEKFKLKKYALAYISGNVNRSELCLVKFIQMVIDKYPNLQEIVCQDWAVDISNKYFVSHLKGVDNIYLKTREDLIVVKNSIRSGRSLTLRCDILPVPNTIMMSIIKYSVADILITGDQSLSDVLSCCAEHKNIFYQIVPWKTDLATELSKELPNKFLKSSKTSCGCSEAITYKSDYKNFVKKWDFRTLGKAKIDAMISSINILNKT